VGVVDVVDRARRHCLWRRKDKEKIHSLAAWSMICKPKNKGGLGIINLRIQNVALLLKYLHKFYNNDDTPWVQLVRDAYYFEAVPHATVLVGSFWWRDVFSLVDQYRVVTTCKIGSGESILFWDDKWKGETMAVRFPRLFSFTKDKLQSVKDFCDMEDLTDGFHLPLSTQAHGEMTQLRTFIENMELTEGVKDTWLIEKGNGKYKPNMIYRLHFSSMLNHTPSSWLWKSKCTSKHKFFAWLILHDRINTKDMLLRRHWNVTNNHSCVLCHDDSYEDWRHLFFNCIYSTRIWNYLQIPWQPGDTLASLITAKKIFQGPCFIEVAILACWNIWKQRNSYIFKHIRPTFRGWKAGFFHDITMLMHRVRDADVDPLSIWLKSLP
jgi:hypothetical protein